MDKYGIKATIFVSTEQDPAPEDRFFNQLQVRDLWPRLRQASTTVTRSVRTRASIPASAPIREAWCSAAYSDYEVTGSRDDILRLTQQKYVWTWCYPCGNCANYESIQKRIAGSRIHRRAQLSRRSLTTATSGPTCRPGIRTR